jgi:hypothetical protein
MRSVLVAMVFVGAVSSVARADGRSPILSVGGMFGGVGDLEAGPEPTWGTRLSVGWEKPLPELPAQPGYKLRGGLVPELFVGGLVLPEAKRADGFFGAGVRAELQFAQREMGLFRVSARGAGYVAARGLVIGEDRTGLFEFALGEYFARHRTATRIGYEFDVLVNRNRNASGDNTAGMLMQIYIGGAL